ncbi:MAG: 1-deoxy-D-xylulose-5-phosphate reductoisomerase, partial [Gammaproteobacteria bacterium]|nr:1-deoxy-D-xylulose-5-phosphate reductoisomerase [Gammaproteobacteria bacterium]
MSKNKAVAILGSTGSIGRNTLDVMRGDPDLQVAALSANNNTAMLAEQCREFEPRYAVMADAERAGE